MKENVKQNTAGLVFAALFTAVIAVFSQIAIPMPFDMTLTLQTFAVALCGYTLGAKRGLASIITYILIGAAGVPIFANFKGGVQVLFGTTGGFLYGFIFLVILCGITAEKKLPFKLLSGAVGLIICHLLGVIQFTFVYKTDFLSAFIMASLPYLLKDFISVAAACLLAGYIRKKFSALI